ncbi:MAG: DHH family phosphoesterase [Clostridia bacterium]
MKKTWKIKEYDMVEVQNLIDTFKISDILSKLLISRNIKFDEINDFLTPDISKLKDPFLLKDMDKFVSRVTKACENKENICIYGDYDVDGVTSIAIMYMFLSKLGCNVSFYLPDRLSEGYGLNINAIDEIKQNNVSFIITVDCGITATNEVEYAKSIGIDICITDHHECGDIIPDAEAVVNPKQKDDISEFKLHAGVGVAYYSSWNKI